MMSAHSMDASAMACSANVTGSSGVAGNRMLASAIRNNYATLRAFGRFGLAKDTNRISARLPSAAAIRRNIAKEWPS